MFSVSGRGTRRGLFGVSGTGRPGVQRLRRTFRQCADSQLRLAHVHRGKFAVAAHPLISTGICAVRFRRRRRN